MKPIKTERHDCIRIGHGYGLDDNILNAYRFLAHQYASQDDVYLFGFSRGAYTVRALAGFLYLIGLLHPDQLNIAGHALVAYGERVSRTTSVLHGVFDALSMHEP